MEFSRPDYWGVAFPFSRGVFPTQRSNPGCLALFLVSQVYVLWKMKNNLRIAFASNEGRVSDTIDLETSLEVL